MGWELAGSGLDAHDPDRHGRGFGFLALGRVDRWDDGDVDAAADVDVLLAGQVEADGAFADGPWHSTVEHLGTVDVHASGRDGCRQHQAAHRRDTDVTGRG